MQNRRERSNTRKGEAGYSWLYYASALNGGVRVVTTILVIGLAAGIFVWYSRVGNDASPDSSLGYTYAIIGTVLLLMSATMYTLRRRSHRQRVIGGLRAALGWHMCFAYMGLAFLCMHSFGELNPRTGTYALYGMIALVISGMIGRLLDRLVPRLIAGEVHQVLTAQGEDRIETISQKLQAIVGHNKQGIRGFAAPAAKREATVATNGISDNHTNNSLVPLPQREVTNWRDQTLHTPWDLAYISLESTPQELTREVGQYRFVPDKKSTLLRPGALIPGTQEHISELEDVQQAMQHELFYRYITRYWRRFHILLALTTVGLLIWHVVYALQLLIPTLLH
jgi:hypothetical protein